MIKCIVLAVCLNAYEFTPYFEVPKYEMRKRRGKSNKGRRRGGQGLR